MEFLAESRENLDRLDQELVELEQNPDAQDILASIFRTIHTIKGTCGFFGFEKLGELTHAGESLLSKMRDGELRIDDRIAGALLKMVDAVREMLASIESSHDEGEGDYSALTARLSDLVLHEAPRMLGEVLIGREQAQPSDVADALDAQEHGDRRKLGQILVEDKGVSAAAVGAALAAQKRAAAVAATAPEPVVAAESSVRVDTAVLDKLMNLAGELVLARNQMMQLAGRLNDAAFTSTCQQLNLITSELREGVMRTRMQPIGHLFAKLPRVVRDLAVACGKQVQVELEGQATDLDRAVLEGIKDPLTHLIRNAVDHGIERPDVRVAAGKPATGTLRVRAFHESGQVNIEIVDDGGGIDPERVAEKAVERGLITFAEAQRMSDRERIDLIFLPGFSTAAKLSSISGRGVGMDVVKTNVQKLGGTVEVQSTTGHGTS
ncbi:MAG TPA: chemotaxis protein CheA, partial [Polyangia bacterium]|nr:chemotaxis protein CheA [Polyangia bacterium]